MDRKWKFLYKGGKASFKFCSVFLWLERGHMTAFGCKRSWVCGKGKMNWLEKIFTPNKSELCWQRRSVARRRVRMACCCWPVAPQKARTTPAALCFCPALSGAAPAMASRGQECWSRSLIYETGQHQSLQEGQVQRRVQSLGPATRLPGLESCPHH